MRRANRYAARYEGGQIVNVAFEELKKGDRFRLFEENGDPVHNQDGEMEFIAASDPYIEEMTMTGAYWAIRIESIARERKKE